MEKIDYNIEKDLLQDDLLIYLRDQKINKALKELKRTDKNDTDIIKDTIKILEEGIPIHFNKNIEAKAVVLPDTDFFNEAINDKDLMGDNTISDEIAKAINNSIKIDPCDPLSVKRNMFNGGMQ